MNQEQQLLNIISDILEIPAASLSLSTDRAELAGWDSMQHLSIVMAVETHFGIQIGFDEVLSIRTPGDLLSLTTTNLQPC